MKSLSFIKSLLIMQWLFMHILNVSNVKNLTSVAEKAAPTWWTMNKTQADNHLTVLSWYAPNVAQLIQKIVVCMENNLYYLNVSSAAILVNGFAGVALIFVMTAIKGNKKASTYQNWAEISFQSARESKNAKAGETMGRMEYNIAWDAKYAEMINQKEKVLYSFEYY